MNAARVPALILLVAGSAAARDVVVFDRGAGAERVAAVRAALTAAGDTVISAEESADLDVAYAAGCGDDAACYARAGVAGSVEAVFVIGAGDVLFVDVRSATGSRKGAPTPSLAAAIDHLAHPEAWGSLNGQALPAGSAVFVDGDAYDGGSDVAVGPHQVEVRAPGREPVIMELRVRAGSDNVLQLPAVAAPPEAGGGVHPGLIVAGVGGAAAVAGVVIFSVGEVAFLEAERTVRDRGRADLDGPAFVANVGLGIIAVGVAAGVAGLVGVLSVSGD